MKKSIIILIIVIILAVIGGGYYFYQKNSQPVVNNNQQFNMNTPISSSRLSKPDLATDFVVFLDKLQKDLNNKDFILKINKHYAPDFDVVGYIELMANVFDVGLKKLPFPAKMTCDTSDQSCTVLFSITGSELTQKYQRESDGIWYQVDAPEPL